MMTFICLWFLTAVFVLAPVNEREFVCLQILFLTDPANPRRIRQNIFRTVRTLDANRPFIQNEEINTEGDANRNGIADQSRPSCP